MKGASLKIFIIVLFFSCNNSSIPETYTSGETTILVDESIAPIIADQGSIFENTYPKAKLNLVYKAQNEVVQLLVNDSARIAILPRELTEEEAKFYENKNIKIRTTRIATDGIALVTHRSNPDTTITAQAILDVLRGNRGNIPMLVFDNPNSSTVSYFKELAGVKNLPEKGVYALKSNPEVIKYVHDHPGAIGVVGVNWIYQPDEKLEQIINKLKIIGVKNEPGKPGSDGYYKPSQNDLALGFYPFMRSLYIINCQGGPTLGAGFASFLAGDRGQRIILKSGLLPNKIPSREVIIKN